MGMGMKSLKWEGIGTKNQFPHTSTSDQRRKNNFSLDGQSRSSRLWLNFPLLGELVGVPVEDYPGSLVRSLTEARFPQEAPR